MSKSAAGSTEQPGKQARAKSCLNNAILAQSWYELRRQLAYKLAWRGGHLYSSAYSAVGLPRLSRSRDRRALAIGRGEDVKS